MLRVSFTLFSAKRTWTKSSMSVASAHFPEAVRAKDPAAQRTSATSAKQQRSWTLHGVNDAACPASAAPRFVQRAVSRVQLYGQLVRFDRPVGWQLLMIPCYWGAGFAVTQAIVREGADPLVLFAPFIPIHLAVFFMVGAYAMRSVGCIVNDMFDREIDRQVERTANRPLASGAVSMAEAWGVLVAHLALAGFIAASLSPVALKACLAITPVWIVYPVTKRLTYFPQIFLGICYSWGVFVGYAAVLGRVDLPICLPLYLSAVCWTILYDTLYAYQDRQDDLKCGVKSTAIWIGDRTYLLHCLVVPISMGLVVSGAMVAQSLPFYVGICMCMYHMRSIVDNVNINDKWSCWQGFVRNVRLGLLVFLCICTGNFMWTIISEHEVDKDQLYDSTDASLRKYLLLNNSIEQSRLYDASSFNTLDRMMHPAYVQREIAKAEGRTEAPPIPVWMRREYFVENLTTLLSLLGYSAKDQEAFSTWMYGTLDHYNLFSKLVL